jgi:hypothetical protein
MFWTVDGLQVVRAWACRGRLIAAFERPGTGMANINKKSVLLPHADEFFIGGQWQKPSDSVFLVIAAPSKERAFSVAEAQAADTDAAASAAHGAFEHPKTSSERTSGAEGKSSAARRIR